MDKSLREIFPRLKWGEVYYKKETFHMRTGICWDSGSATILFTSFGTFRRCYDGIWRWIASKDYTLKLIFEKNKNHA